jgi:hypothetical protein
MSYRVIVLLLALVGGGAAPARGQAPYSAPKARRHFVSLSYDWLNTRALHFAEHPVADLVGRPVSRAQFEAYDYRTRDGDIIIDVLEFKHRGHGAGITVYPFGASVGATLALRASVEDLPTIRLAFAGTGAPAPYIFTGAHAVDFSAGVLMSDRSSGWGLGSHAFVLAGMGRIRSDAREGDRVFAEGGGGLTSGPFGVELSLKFAWNHLTDPVDHHFFTVPVTIRATVTF